MTKTFTYFSPPATVTGLSATTAAGGSLTAGKTYYYVVMSVTHHSFGGRNLYCYSPASTEVSATTDATNKTINLSWTGIVDPDLVGYIVFRAESSGAYYGIKTKRATAAQKYTTTGTTYSDDDTGSHYYNRDTQAVYPTSLSLPLGIDPWTNGQGCLVFSGGTTADPITFADIYSDAVTNGYTSQFKKSSLVSASCLLQIEQNKSVETHFSSKGETFYFFGLSFILDDASGSSHVFGATDSNGLPSNPTEFWQAPAFSKIYFYSTEINGLRVRNAGSGTAAWGQQDWYPWGSDIGVGFYMYDDCTVNGLELYWEGTNPFAAPKKYIPIDNFFCHSRIADWGVYGQVAKDVTVDGDVRTLLNVGANTRFVRWNLRKNSSQMTIRHKSPDVVYMIDPTHPYSDSLNHLTALIYAKSSTYTGHIKQGSSFIMRVIDDAGSGISGATITFTDTNGDDATNALDENTLKSLTSNTDGYFLWEQNTITGVTDTTITVSGASWTTDEWRGYRVFITSGSGAGQEQMILSNTATVLTLTGAMATTPAINDRFGIIPEVNVLDIYNDGTGYATYDDLNPFTFSVSASGYETYTSKLNINATTGKGTALQITLKNTVPVRPTTSGQDAVAVQPQLGSKSLLEI